MKRTCLSLLSTILLTSYTLGAPCDAKHCYKDQNIDESLFDSSSVCGLDLEKVKESADKGDPFSKEVKLYALYKKHIGDAHAAGNKKVLKDLQKEAGEFIENLEKAGLMPEQIANIPPITNFVCKKFVKPQKEVTILDDVVVGSKLFDGKHPVINVFTTDNKNFNPDVSHFDFCKIEACNKLIRGRGQSDSMCTALSNYMSQKDVAKKFENMPAPFAKQMMDKLKETEAETEAKFAAVNIPPKLLHELPAWSEFRCVKKP